MNILLFNILFLHTSEKIISIFSSLMNHWSYIKKIHGVLFVIMNQYYRRQLRAHNCQNCKQCGVFKRKKLTYQSSTLPQFEVVRLRKRKLGLFCYIFQGIARFLVVGRWIIHNRLSRVQWLEFVTISGIVWEAMKFEISTIKDTSYKRIGIFSKFIQQDELSRI